MRRSDVGLAFLVASLFGLLGGTPFDHPDFVTGHVGQVVTHFGNPKFFNYPSLLIYLFTLLYGAIFVVLYLAGAVRTTREFKALIDAGTLISDPIVIPAFLPGHIVIVLFSFLGLYSIMSLTLRITGRRLAAVLALSVAGLSLLWVSNAHMLTVDLPSTALVIAAVASYVAIGADARSSGKRANVPAILAGLATAVKYPSGLLVWCLGIAEVAAPDRTLRDRLRRAFRVGLVALVTFLVVNPFILLDFGTFWRDLFSELRHSSGGHHGFASTGFSHHFVESLGVGIGMPALLAGVVGLGLFARNVAFSRRERLAVLLFPILHMGMISVSQLGFHRYALPVVPFLACGVGYLAYWAHRRLSIRLVFVVGLCLIAVLWHAQSTVAMLRLLRGPDTRRILADVLPNLGGVEHVWVSTYARRVLDPELTSTEQPPFSLLILEGFSIDRHVAEACSLDDLVVRELLRFDTVLVINPFSVPRSQVPYSSQSMYAPYPPDLAWRRMAGPYIEVYFDGSRPSMIRSEVERPGMTVLPAEQGFYRQMLARQCVALPGARSWT
jgi:hypothetical protein